MEKRTLTDNISKEREDSERMESWVSGRGNKRGSKSRPGPGVANERAPAGSSRGFEQAVTSLGASRRHPFHLRSMTRPCASRSISHPFPAVPVVRDIPLSLPHELNRVLVPVFKGAAAVSATWQPCLYLASTPSRHFVAHLFLSPITLHGWSWSLPLSLSFSLSPFLSLYLFLSVWSVSLAIPFVRWYKQRNCASVEFSCRWFEQRLIIVVDKGTPGIVPSSSSCCQYGLNRHLQMFDENGDDYIRLIIFENNYETSFIFAIADKINAFRSIFSINSHKKIYAIVLKLASASLF